VSSFPERPTIGRRARERRITQLREQEQAAALEIDQQGTTLRQLEASFATTDQLLAGADVLAQGDPSPELEISHRVTHDATRDIGLNRELRRKYEGEIESLRPICQDLRKLIPVAWLLDEPDHYVRAEELRRRLEDATAATNTLKEVHPHRLLLEQKLDVLREQPPSEAEVVKIAEQRDNLQQQQETLSGVLISLRYVDEHRAALDWTDAQEVLRRETRLAPTLQEQLERAINAASTAQAEMDDAEKVLETTTTELSDAYANTKSIEESLNRDREEWLQLGIQDARDEVVAATKSEIRSCESEILNLESQDSNLFKQLSQLELLRSQTDAELISARKQLEDSDSAWKPEQERWQRLRASAENSGVLASTLTPRFVEAFSGQGSPNLRSRAKEHASALKERLGGAREAEQVQAVVKGLLGSQELSGEMYLQAWIEVRNWLRRRMPTQIAEVDDPLEALRRLKEHLALLESRLQRQETELRGNSEDVARNIDIHIRRAQKQVKRLNLDLEQARFGSIQGVHLHLQRMERMDKVLSALREGQAQELLFKPEMPIEEALEEIFRRHAGERSGGQKLLDYREYLDPKVTVKRRGSEEWEVVNPIRLSTGEGIGIGAAVMMVVLASWERDANLLRPKRFPGTLRLLFLDEANRLDKDSLGVLFDLCQSLELQLIVAAPEVARAEGNTTYRLIRRVSSNGHDEVIATGRRAAGESA
jgi:chromosome partition protein MukB